MNTRIAGVLICRRCAELCVALGIGIVISLPDVAAARTAIDSRTPASCAPTSQPTVARTETSCTGDCNGDRSVSVNELVYGVNVALGNPGPTLCPGFGQTVRIDTLLTAVINALTGCITSTTYDLSEFSMFTFQREAGFGFCPRVGSLYSADLQRLRSGAYRLGSVVLVAGDPEIDDCLEGFIDLDGTTPCAVPRRQPCRLLTDAERESVRTAFAAVTAYTGPERFCSHIAYDPCVINAIEWDLGGPGSRFRATDYPCTDDPRLEAAEIDRITALLESLGSGAATECPDVGGEACGNGIVEGGEGCDDGKPPVATGVPRTVPRRLSVAATSMRHTAVSPCSSEIFSSTCRVACTARRRSPLARRAIDSSSRPMARSSVGRATFRSSSRPPSSTPYRFRSPALAVRACKHCRRRI